MKKKMRKILFDSWIAAGSRTWVYLLVVLAAGTLLSLTLFFSGGNSVENTLASSINLSLAYSNNSFVSPHYDNQMQMPKLELVKKRPDLNKEVYQMFVNNLDTLASSPEVTYFNFNFESWLQTDQSDSFQVFGINDSRFFAKENIRIIEGTGEIKEGEAVVSDQQVYNTLLADGTLTQRKAVLGDTYTFVNTYDKERGQLFTLKVVGIYQGASIMQSDSEDDDFIGSNGIVTTNSMFTQLLADHPEYYGGYIAQKLHMGTSNLTGEMMVITDPEYFDADGNFLNDKAAIDYHDIDEFEVTSAAHYSPMINHIVLETDTFEHYASLKQKFDKFSLETNRNAAKLFDEFIKDNPKYSLKFMLQTNENYFGSILDSIARIKKFYLFIFLSIYILLMLSLYSFINYMQYDRSREIFIKYSLGSSRRKISRYYMKYYALPGLAASIIACIPGYLLSWMLSSSTAAASVQRQNEFIRVEEGTQTVQYTGVSLFDLSWQRMLLAFAAVLLIMELVIMACAWISTMRVLRGSLSNHARGGR